jgi:cyclopropane fatty-acyl-phospholipid synthase-like methyltransferase
MKSGVTQKVPAYFDYLLEAFRQGRQGRFVHLGHWDSPPADDAPLSREEFNAAQTRMNEILLEMAQLQHEQHVLDVGCGLGGTLQRINETFQRVSLVGVNIDPRQLHVCAQLEAVPGNQFHWHEADACRMPFADNSFDRILCIEALFHFQSRQLFFEETARLLRPGGILVISDIVVHRDRVEARMPGFCVAAALNDGYGPWPHPWGKLEELCETASLAGLNCQKTFDATDETLPSHRFTVPQELDEQTDPGDPLARSALMLQWLHKQRLLQYVYLQFSMPS